MGFPLYIFERRMVMEFIGGLALGALIGLWISALIRANRD